MADSTASLQPVTPILAPAAGYHDADRSWQGIPGIERAANGRLWATWYSGGKDEGPENFILLVTSDDDGKSWSAPRVIIDPPGQVRAFDPCLWHDPHGRLWFFWAQSLGHFDGRCGVWALVSENSAAADARWSAPRRLCHGIMMNKPTVLRNGEWLLPAAIWHRAWTDSMVTDWAAAAPVEQRRSNVVVSDDAGVTWSWRGGAEVPERTADEHMIIERTDGSLWLPVRTRAGIGEAVSYDGGRTWGDCRTCVVRGPSSRFFARRLKSGKLLLVHHGGRQERSHLTALLSDDDGRTWHGGLLLDARDDVAYPDGVEAGDGLIYIIYDHDRYGDREILLAVFREADVVAGHCVSADARLGCIVNRLPRPQATGERETKSRR